MTTRIFSSDGNHQDTWTPVQQAADTDDIDFEYSAVENNPGNPTDNRANWHNAATQNDIWMAISRYKNGTWGSWDILRIKGENGADGAGIVGVPVITYGVSPTGDNMPSTWVSDLEDLVVPNGYWLWVKTVTTYTTGTVTSYTKQRQTKDGASTACPFRGAYDSSATYYGNSTRTDIVFDPTTNAYYRANPNAPTSPFSEATTSGASVLSNTDYWLPFGANYDNIATGFAFIENLTVMNLDTAGEDETPQARIHASGNTMYMTDDNGEQRFVLTGDEIDTGTPASSYSIDGTSLYDYVNKDDSGGSDTSKSGSGSLLLCGRIGVSAGDTLRIPEMTVGLSYFENNDDYASANIKVRLMRNNTIASTLWEGSLSGASTHVIQATDFSNLTPGTYSIVLYATWNMAIPYESISRSLSINIGASAVGNVLVTGANKRLVQIGANGIAIHLGGSFSAVFATDPNNNDAPMIVLQGLNSNNQLVGLKVTSQGVMVSQDGTWKKVATTS